MKIFKALLKAELFSVKKKSFSVSEFDALTYGSKKLPLQLDGKPRVELRILLVEVPDHGDGHLDADVGHMGLFAQRRLLLLIQLIIQFNHFTPFGIGMRV